MPLTKEKEQELHKLGEFVIKIAESFNDYKDVEYAMKSIFTELTDLESPRLSEFNSTYNIQEIGHSPCCSYKKVKLKKAFGVPGKYKVMTELYFYEKAPNDVVILQSIYNINLSKKLPIFISLYIDERNKNDENFLPI